ncbi:MAG: hypothetical protein ACFE9Z_06510 [Promethearchaeota archaeon]
MSSIIYKVIFKAIEQFENKNLTLSFRRLKLDRPIQIPRNCISKLKNISEQNNQIINFQNIEEVLVIGNPGNEYSYNYFLVLLYTEKNSGPRTGYLIGNTKSLGDIIIGIWPFNLQINDLTLEKVLEDFSDVTDNPEKYSSICLISQ